MSTLLVTQERERETESRKKVRRRTKRRKISPSDLQEQKVVALSPLSLSLISFVFFGTVSLSLPCRSFSPRACYGLAGLSLSLSSCRAKREQTERTTRREKEHRPPPFSFAVGRHRGPSLFLFPIPPSLVSYLLFYFSLRRQDTDIHTQTETRPATEDRGVSPSRTRKANDAGSHRRRKKKQSTMAATEALRQLREEAYCRVVKCFLAGEYSMVRKKK